MKLAGADYFKDYRMKRFGYTEDAYITERVQGLYYLQDKVKGMTVLDMGCAEGLISNFMMRWGASLAHGFDKNGARVQAAREIKHNYPNVKFEKGDFSFPKAFFIEQEWLNEKYDIVLLLSAFHTSAPEKIEPFLEKTNKYFCYRGEQYKEVTKLCEQHGFKKVSGEETGGPQIYEKL